MEIRFDIAKLSNDFKLRDLFLEELNKDGGLFSHVHTYNGLMINCGLWDCWIDTIKHGIVRICGNGAPHGKGGSWTVDFNTETGNMCNSAHYPDGDLTLDVKSVMVQPISVESDQMIREMFGSVILDPTPQEDDPVAGDDMSFPMTYTDQMDAMYAREAMLFAAKSEEFRHLFGSFGVERLNAYLEKTK